MFKKNKDKKIEKNKDNKFKSKNTKNIEKSRTETGLLLDGNRDGEKSALPIFVRYVCAIRNLYW